MLSGKVLFSRLLSGPLLLSAGVLSPMTGSTVSTQMPVACHKCCQAASTDKLNSSNYEIEGF